MLALTYFSVASVAQPYQYIGLEKFSASEQQKIKQWLEVAQTATEETLGPYPFPVDLHINSRKANEPVPWANTWREGTQSIHFYIDTRFSLKRFVEDWTSYHEVSHLALPYLGSRNRWFAEGFASFMQYQIMHNAGVLKKTPRQSYRFKLSPHLSKYQQDESAMDVISNLFNKKRYKAGYWAGAWYFIMADQRLKQQNMSLNGVVKQYLACCRIQDNSLNDVIKSWDDIVGKPLFSDLLDEFHTQPAHKVFPKKY